MLFIIKTNLDRIVAAYVLGRLVIKALNFFNSINCQLTNIVFCDIFRWGRDPPRSASNPTWRQGTSSTE